MQDHISWTNSRQWIRFLVKFVNNLNRKSKVNQNKRMCKEFFFFFIKYKLVVIIFFLKKKKKKKKKNVEYRGLETNKKK